MIQSGKIKRPQKVVITGVPGCGKSTFAAQFPKPIFLDIEDRTAHLDIDRIVCRDYETFRRALAYVGNTNDYKTVVIDGADWLEHIIKTDIVETDGKQSIEEAAGGWGKGYKKTSETIGKILIQLETLMRENAMNVVIIGHVKCKKFDDPIAAQSYDRYTLACLEATSAQLMEWCDSMLFINYDDNVITKTGEKTRATGGRIRMCYTERCAAYDAKNSWQLPQSFPLDYATIAPHIGEYTPVVSEAKQKKALREKVLEIAEPMGGADYVKKELTGRKFNDLTLDQCQEFLETITEQAADFAIMKENK